MEDEFAQLGRLKGAVALLSAASRSDLPQSAISMPPPEDTLPSSIPDSPEALHRYLTSHFDSLFAADTSYPPPYLDPLSRENIQSKTFKAGPRSDPPSLTSGSRLPTNPPYYGASGIPSVTFLAALR